MKWKHFPRYKPFARGIHWSPVNSPHKRQWRGALMFSLFCAWTNSWANNENTCDLRRHRAHYDVTLMLKTIDITQQTCVQIYWLYCILHGDRCKVIYSSASISTLRSRQHFPQWKLLYLDSSSTEMCPTKIYLTIYQRWSRYVSHNPLSGPVMAYMTDVYMHHWASMTKWWNFLGSDLLYHP